jgi:hypothetical protein
MNLPRLRLNDRTGTAATADSVLLAVYAPFGTDATLSTFPDGSSQDLIQHPLVQSLLQVSVFGIHVMALIDRYGDDTYLVEIPAGKTAEIKVTSRWKQDMASSNNLSGFLQHAWRAHPGSSLVLALEGHGAGFLPDLDRSQLTQENVTRKGAFEWRIEATQSAPVKTDGSPVLPGGYPQLPGGYPQLPVNHMPLSTFGLGAALKSALAAGVPTLSVIHFNNCFNMSTELLHTVAPYAEYATAYINYNFFTSGAAYPTVFEKLAAQGTATPQELASWFALANHDYLAAKGNHPTVGCAIELARMKEIAERVDDMSDALLAALRVPSAAQRADTVEKIKRSIIRAQQLDADGDMELETPDQMTDLRSLAHELQAEDFGEFAVKDTAAALEKALAGIKQYGDSDDPWTLPSGFWDFSSEFLAMNIFLPDPILVGLWDWRSPYYLDVNPDPTAPRVQPNIIDFLQVTDWVDFIIEYHKDVKFVGLLPASIPEFPVFNAKYEPPRDDPKDPPCPPPPPCDPPKDPPK